MNHISDTTDIGITFQMTLDGGSQSLPQLAKETDDCKRSAGDLHRLYRGLPSAGNQ